MSYNPVPPQQIPEVIAFHNAKAQLEWFKQQNPQLFSTLDVLIDNYNTTLEAAEKAVRGANASCGDFDMYQRITKVDGKALHDAVGREAFISIGGTIKKETTYKVDNKRLQLAVAQNKVPKEVVDEVTKEEPRYHMPKPAVMP